MAIDLANSFPNPDSNGVFSTFNYSLVWVMSITWREQKRRHKKLMRGDWKHKDELQVKKTQEIWNSI